jgi:DNA-directed RNA polymerase specialized sigma24 family protein
MPMPPAALTPEQSALAAALWPRVSGLALAWLRPFGHDEGAVLDAAGAGLLEAVASPRLRPDVDPWGFVATRVKWRLNQALRRQRTLRRRGTGELGAVTIDRVEDLLAAEPRERAVEPGDPRPGYVPPAERFGPLLDRLHPRHREVVVRHFLGGETYVAIGRAMGLTADTARQIGGRSMTRMRTMAGMPALAPARADTPSEHPAP